MDEIDVKREEREEARELETIVEVVGDNVAQNCARKHLLSNLVEATQRGYWAA